MPLQGPQRGVALAVSLLFLLVVALMARAIWRRYQLWQQRRATA